MDEPFLSIILQGTDSEITVYKNQLVIIIGGKQQTIVYTLFYYGKNVLIEKAKIKGNYFVQNNEFDQMKSFSEQFGGNLYQALYEKTRDNNWLLSEKMNN